MINQLSPWIFITLKEVVSHSKTGLVRSAAHQGSNREFPYIKMNNINKSGNFVHDEIGFVDASIEEVKDNQLEDGDFIFNTRNSLELVGKCGIYRKPDKFRETPILYNNNLLKIQFNSIDARIVFYWLNSPLGKEKLNAIKSSTTSVAAIYQRDLLKIKVPFPPLAEQIRIAQKLDELLAQVDTLKARIDVIPALLKRFRQSVLAAAVSGRLTNEWREAVPNAKVVSIPSEKEINLGEIEAKEKYLNAPTTWQWMKFGAAVSLINGDRGKNYPNKSEYVEQGIPFINTGHIDPNGMLSADRMNFITKKKFDSLGGGKIKSGDLVYCLRGATMGKTAFVNPLTVGAIASSLVIVRTKSLLLPSFSYLFLTSPQGKNLITRFDNGSAQPNLSAGSLSSYPIAIPPLAEQTEIVRRVEQLFAFADNLEAKVAAAKSRIDNLTQSILAKAFRGELVPQDPNDEPASVLLERIKAQRAAAPKAKRSRKTSA